MKDVLIEIKGCQSSDGMSDEVELTTVGKIEYGNGFWKLTYSEKSDDFTGKVFTTLKKDITGAVTLDKTGDNESHLTIQKGHRHTSLYSMGPCEFTMGTFGVSVDDSIGEHGGVLNMKYTLDINSAYAGTNEINIKVREI